MQVFCEDVSLCNTEKAEQNKADVRTEGLWE